MPTAAPPPRTGGPAPPWPGRSLRYVPGHALPDGDDVLTWQRRMAERGWPITVDGAYGPQSADVARRFQAEHGLPVDGVVGPIAWAAAWTTPIS